MDDPNSSSSSEEEKEFDNMWNLDPKKEKIFWDKYLLNKYIYPPTTSSKCFHQSYRIYEKKNLDILNPYYMRCNRPRCRYKSSLREYLFLLLHPKIPGTYLIKILELFIKSKNNANQTFEITAKKISYQIIIKVLVNIRYAIADYLKDKYRKFQIGGDPTTNKIVALDEYLILHDKLNQQI